MLRARDRKAHEAREREERWEQDKLQAARKREEEAAQAIGEQRREKERMLARLDAMAKVPPRPRLLPLLLLLVPPPLSLSPAAPRPSPL